MSSLHIYRTEIYAYALCTLRSISFCIDTFNFEITWNFITLMVIIDFFSHTSSYEKNSFASFEDVVRNGKTLRHHFQNICEET